MVKRNRKSEKTKKHFRKTDKRKSRSSRKKRGGGMEGFYQYRDMRSKNTVPPPSQPRVENNKTISSSQPSKINRPQEGVYRNFLQNEGLQSIQARSGENPKLTEAQINRLSRNIHDDYEKNDTINKLRNLEYDSSEGYYNTDDSNYKEPSVQLYYKAKKLFHL